MALKRNFSFSVYSILSGDELPTLQRSIGEFISVNTFFSTRAIRQRASGFLKSCKISNDLH